MGQFTSAVWRVSVASAVCLLGLASALAGSGYLRVKAAPRRSHTDWGSYLGSPGNSHYSDLKQINSKNVSKLQEVWRFDTGETGGLETTPLILDGVLYAYTPTQKVFALDASNGKQIWQFDPGRGAVPARAERGLAYWTDGTQRRLFAGSANFVYAIDAATGKGIPEFGDNGRIDLRENLRGDPKLQSVTITSPGVIYKDLLILGDGTPEQLPAPPGDIRAYDVRSGKLRWTFHTIPHPGEFGYSTWPKEAWKSNGAANNWCGMAVDLERGIVYVPTGSAATDWYGADRVGDNLFANSLIALKAETGERLWHFQGVKHDLWDRDFPSPPTLITVTRDGLDVPAVVQTSKQGFLFLFNRVDGKPLFPIEYRKVPSSTVAGEVTASEQPFPVLPVPFSRQGLTESDLTNLTPEAHQNALEQLRTFVSGVQFTPNRIGQQTVMFPGYDGGAEWGGSAYDPATHILYLNANDVGLTNALVKRAGGTGGRAIYLNQCAACHGEHRAGSPPTFPSLLNIQEKYSPDEIMSIIEHGKGRMPSFPTLTSEQRRSIATALVNGDEGQGNESGPATYNVTGYKRFLDQQGYPANSPPWGTLNAINMDTGKYVWKVTLGQYPELVAKGIPDTGSENYGGPVVTAGGVVFIGATVLDKKLRAFDKATGKLLWEGRLPLSGNATPAVYEVEGKEYVVIAAGGDRDPSTPKKGGIYVAFALPQ